MPQPSLYEILLGNFSSGVALDQISEENQVILSVLENMQRILNCRAGTLSHLPDYGLPDMSMILHGLPRSAQSLLAVFSETLLKYEPRLKSLNAVLLPQTVQGQLEYGIDAELKDFGLVRFGTAFMPEGRVLIRHLKQQHYV